MAIKLKSTFVRALLTVCIVSFSILLLGRGWTRVESGDRVLEDSVIKFDHFDDKNVQSRKPDVINLAVVVCGDRFNDTVIMLKSAVAFTSTPLHFIIFADNELQPLLNKQLVLWEKTMAKNLTHSILDIVFPVQSGQDEWRKLFKPCASQRLFLPTILQDIDSLIYVDTDTIFLNPLDHIWSFFYKMNSTQIAALTPEHEDFTTGWYNRFAKHPYYGPLGVNSGVMLMNLTRMRDIEWQQLVMPIYTEYKLKITWGDQDIINILFYLHPAKLYVMPCEWNYRPDHCMYLSVCKSAERHGVSVLHGNRGAFHGTKHAFFKAVYDAFDKYELGSSMDEFLLMPLKRTLIQSAKHTNCAKIYKSLIKQLQTFVYSHQ